VKIASWRLVRRERAGDAFSGEGARLFGGRWNSPGTAVVYTSDTLSLAALETLVHINPQLPLDYVAFPVEFEDALVESLEELPSGWKNHPPPPAAQQVGNAWAKSARSAVLAVPSVLVPVQRNFLLNPAHPDFRRIRIGAAKPFAFDSRLLGP
jgi:RES domain-containing protein